jgi:hypothetical protein
MSDQADSESKSKMPQVLKDLGAKAIERMDRRSATPEVEIANNDAGWTFNSPYREEDRDEWEALLFDAFATRSLAAFHVFTTQLSQLCSTEWHGEGKGWVPDSWELRAAIQIVRSVRPRNEAEACLAAQMVAVHRMQMKLSAQALSQSWPEPRTCAIAGKLARTYAIQLETMAKLKGRGSRQRITVRKFSKHEHKHIHLYQGGIENGDQPHGPSDDRANQIKAPLELEGRAALLGPDAPSDTVSVPGSTREGALSPARRRQGVRGSCRSS